MKVTGTQAPRAGVETHAQAKKRRYATFTDQHGREWGAVIETTTGVRVSPAEPRFSAPVYPPDDFIRHDPTNLHRVDIDYLAWRRASREAVQQWEEAVERAALAIGNEGQVGALIQNPTREILAVTGPRPRGVVDEVVIQAAEAGNRWILFAEGEMPEKAAPYFPFEVQADDSRTLKVRPVAKDPFAPDEPEGDAEPAPEPAPGLNMYAPGLWQLVAPEHPAHGTKLEGRMSRAEAEAVARNRWPDLDIPEQESAA